MQTVFLIAKILSAVSLLVVLALIVNLWRRPELPAFSYGTVTLSPRRRKWLWFAFVLGALGVGSSRDPVATRTDDMKNPARVVARAGLSLNHRFAWPGGPKALVVAPHATARAAAT